MPWNKTSTMDQKRLFIKDYIRGAFAMAELCRRYGISRPTGYKWVARFEADERPGTVNTISPSNGRTAARRRVVRCATDTTSISNV